MGHKNNRIMAKKQYKIRARLVFAGEFKVRAESREQAEEKVRNSCGALLGKVDSTDEDIDWDIPMHAEIEIKRKREE